MTSPEPSLLRRMIRRAIALSGIAAALLLGWWMRIEAARSPDLLPEIRLGESVSLGRTQLRPDSLTLEDGRLVLRALAENVTGETQSSPFGIPARPPEAVIGDSVLPTPEIVLLRDQAPLGQLQPLLPEEISMIWTLPEDWRPVPVTLRFSRETFKLRDNLYGQASWLGHVPAATLTALPGTAP